LKTYGQSGMKGNHAARIVEQKSSMNNSDQVWGGNDSKRLNRARRKRIKLVTM
jgi:hypothetical protein